MSPGWRQQPRAFAPQASVTAASVREAVGHEYTCFMRRGEDTRLHGRFIRRVQGHDPPDSDRALRRGVKGDRGGSRSLERRANVIRVSDSGPHNDGNIVHAADAGSWREFAPRVWPSAKGLAPSRFGGVSNVDIDRNNTLQIKAIEAVISTFETLPRTCLRLARRAPTRTTSVRPPS